MNVEQHLTRRGLLSRGALAGAGLTLAPRLIGSAGTARAAGTTPAAGTTRAAGLTRARRRSPIPLPTPAQVRADFTKMVRFGPRLTGSEAHNNYIQWLGGEFEKAGLELSPCDVYETDRWLAEKAELTILEGTDAGPVKVATYMPRSQQTASAGVTGPLVYGGPAPAVSASGADIDALFAAIEAYPAALEAWAQGLQGTLGGSAKGSVLLIDLPMPLPITAGAFLPIATYLNWPGHSEADWATSDYKRTWIEPGVEMPLAPFQSLGAAAVVLIVDASYDALAGGYLPFLQDPQPLPALYVDRDTGQRLRDRAKARPRTRLTLTATRRTVPTPAITAVLPGESDETLIFNTHTDGQGFAEENAGVAFVHLARYFATLPPAQRLKRTLVFAAWPGHMTYDLPETQGWIADHPDLVKKAAAALTVEHLGCTEWDDSIDSGYHPTGNAELFGIWTTQGPMFEIVKASVIKHDIPRAALLRPPVQFGVGGAFQEAGVPQIGAIAGPYYLVTVSPDGDLDKLDEALAARQIAWLADLAKQLDSIPAATLRKGDPTLGQKVGIPSGATASSVRRECIAPTPQATRLTTGNVVAEFHGSDTKTRGAVVELWTTHGTARDVEVELLHGRRVLARSRVGTLGAKRRRVLLRAAHGERLAAGSYVVRVTAAHHRGTHASLSID